MKMRYFMRLLVMGSMALAGFAVQAQGKAHLVKKGMCPFSDGFMEKVEYTSFVYEPPKPGTYILGKDSGVRACRAGVVMNVFDIGGSKAVMVHCGALFYTFVGMDTVFVIRGQRVAAGEIIGSSKERKIEFVVSNKDGELFWPYRYLDCQIKVVKQP